MATSLVERIDRLNMPIKAPAQKSYTGGGSLFDWGYGHSVSRDLRLDEYGAAQAVAVVTEVQRAVRFWQQWLGGLTWNLYDGNSDKIIISSRDRKPPIGGGGALWFNTVRRFSRNWKHGLFESIAFSDWVYAETYIGKLRNQVQVADFMWLNPLATEPMIVAGEIDYYTYQSSDPDIPYQIRKQDVAYRIAQRNPFDDWRGSSPVLTVIDKINLQENVHKSLNSYFRNNMQLGGIVSGKPSTEGAWSVDGQTLDEIKTDMQRNHRGVNNAFRWFFSNAPIETHQFTLLDIEKHYTLVEPLRKQISHGMGVPPVLSGDPTEVNYDNADKVMRNWWATDGIPYATQIADFVNEDLLPAIEPDTDMYFGFDFVQYETEDPVTVSTDFTSQIIPINIAQLKRGYEVDEDLKDIYIVGGVPMHKSIIVQVAMQVPPQFAQPAAPAPMPTGEPTAPPATDSPVSDVTPVTEPVLPVADTEVKKKYDPSQPRDESGQFGSGGGSSGSGDSSGGSDKPKKPEKPKKGKPDWAKKENRVAGRDSDGYQDYGHIARNPRNADSNGQINAMSESHVSNLDKKQQNAVTTYTGESYQAINGGLRGQGNLTATQQRTVDNLDSAIASNSLSEPTILYRGMRVSPELESRLTTGSTFTDSAYTSATFDQAMGDGFAPARDGALMRIKAPAGTNGIAVSSISNYSAEQEFLLPRNTSYRITGVTRDSRGQYFIDAEIVTSDGETRSIRFAIRAYKEGADTPKDRSDKFNWSIDDIVFDEPETDDSDSADEDDSEPSEDTEKHVHIDGHHLAVETWDYTPDKARKELAVWQKHVKSGSKRPFAPIYTRGDIADSVIAGLADNAEITAIFDTAFALLPVGLTALENAFKAFIDALQADDADTATKSLQSIRLDFESRFEDVLRDIRSGNIENRRRAGDILRQIIRTFGYRAFVQGLQDGGVMDEPSEEDEAEINRIRSEQSSYVSSITQVLILGDGVSDTQAAGKPLQWWNKSIVPFYYAGYASAQKNALMEFVGDDGLESCSTCKRLKGQRHRLKDWKRKQLIPQVDTANYECGGWQCQHKLIPAAGKAQGKF